MTTTTTLASPLRTTVDPSFELRLVEAIRPITEHFLAVGIHHLFDTGIYDALADRPPVPIPALADELTMDVDRLRGFLLYLANEDIVQLADDRVALTGRARGLDEFRAWYTFLIGGYATTIQQIGGALARGAPDCTRNGAYVGVGSCEISRYDGMPMTLDLLEQGGVTAQELLDLGCGNALYLTEFAKAVPGLRAVGVEPDPDGYRAAVGLVERTGMAERVRLVNASATDFLRDPPPECRPDLIVLGYVLQEILAQEGEEAVLDLLRDVVARFPRINVVVIEVSDEIGNPAVMRHGVARNFWNPYFLIHYFTRQRLARKAYWDELFRRAGLTVAGFTSTDPHIDSSGIELGYLLRGPDYH
ncbi:methyltransferase domain-containing protein [Nonomuraea sp. MTCD27]|uniref:methyltransferase domain-containing protein n=1 Tax=Nonomuraea sp. MTCD27 TaxID=1676747 RepID=UPI0035BFC002